MNEQTLKLNQIEQVIAYAKEHAPQESVEKIIQFIRLFFYYCSIEDLQNRSLMDLYGALISQWQLMERRRPKELKINVFNPTYEEHGWQSIHTVIEMIIDDMPFLVDSIRIELNRLGLTTHLMIFTSGAKVVRDEKGKIIDLFSHDTKSATAMVESPIYLEIDRQTDPKILSEIQSGLRRVIQDVRSAVQDWQKMQDRVNELLHELRQYNIPLKHSEIIEAIAFLEWLLSDHFTFLGVRDYEVEGSGEEAALRLVSGSGLGVLRDDTHSKVYRHFADLPEQARALMLSKDLILIISKTNTRSTIHRRTYTDYIGVKRFNEKGELIGERRFIGLYTSTAYSANPKDIPFLRKKVAWVMKKAGFPEKSHAGKTLAHILMNLPRDDVFQATEKELYSISLGILQLQERRRIRLFMRKDAYGRFFSCLVYLPRENFSTDLIYKMQNILMNSLGGLDASFTTSFSESILARIHYIIRVDSKKPIAYDAKLIEQQLAEIGKSWSDGLRENILEFFGEERGNYLNSCYENAFPAGYREAFSSQNAILDIENIEKLSNKHLLEMSFYRPVGAPKNAIRFKLYRIGQPIPLSDALPMLENMGLRVIGEQPYLILPEHKSQIWVNDFGMTYSQEPTFEVEKVKSVFQEAFNKIWSGEAENDPLNRLVLEAQLSYNEISILRAYMKYLRQTLFTFSPQYISETLVNHAQVSKLLVELFKCYFDPKKNQDRQIQIERVEELVQKKVDEIAILDEDRILRRMVDIIRATTRTNYFQKDAKGRQKSYLSFKFDPSKIPDLPLPLPKFEIFVYSPNFEGIHLRAASVARGGIRWSDRREDFRTEVLGLMKAQQVKNAVIVPAGAKGGFVPKNIPADATREQIMEIGIACYKEFITGLLDLTDNLVRDKVTHPERTVCYDDDDFYLVVAADKGTATFSDIANQISMDRGFWLGDAFASGGSTGYDHKKMGITARGAWVSAERHFQEVGININNTDIIVAGIGDMSGDVFGNGMLLSRRIKLVAAFNHQHIFIDPNPDTEISFEERLRLFNLPRSNWDDYNRELISPGGGVYLRTAKAIMLTPEIKKLLDVSKDVLVPNDLIKAILRAPLDLLWNGGIGTYVKATTELNSEVGDRANDATRINGNELRTRVVCEGGNLGLTQLARVEYELNGGKINTDFVDNSGGVDCSDHEVNIKILLDSIVAKGDLTKKHRNQLLAKMTDEISDLVLQNNYHQNQAISLASFLAPHHMGLYINFINVLEETRKIDRKLEFLPDHKTLLERKANGLSLTRPELAILFSYSKILLDERIRKSELTKDSFLSQMIKNAFPLVLRKRYESQMQDHGLAREIISTQISNQLVSEMGIAFIFQMHDETGAPTAAIVRAYMVAREIFHMSELNADIESLDYHVGATVQLKMYDEVVRLVRRATRWFLRNRRGKIHIEETIHRFSEAISGLFKRLPKLISGSELTELEEHRDGLIAANVPADIAFRIASSPLLYHALNIVEASRLSKTDIYDVGKIYFTLVDRLGLGWFREHINTYPMDNRWCILAKASYKGDLDRIQRDLIVGVLKYRVSRKSIHASLEFWFERHRGLIERWQKILSDLRSLETKDFSILAVAIRELSDLAQVSSAPITSKG